MLLCLVLWSGQPKDLWMILVHSGTIDSVDLAATQSRQKFSIRGKDLELILFDEPRCLMVRRKEAATTKELVPDQDGFP